MECRTIEEALKIHDIAEAARHYAKVRDLGFEAINNDTELKIRAERKIGEFSRELERKERRLGFAHHDGEQTKTQTLKQAGIDPSHGNRYEAIAAIPEEVFEGTYQGYGSIRKTQNKAVVKRTASTYTQFPMPGITCLFAVLNY
jgi:hypothetical protein